MKNYFRLIIATGIALFCLHAFTLPAHAAAMSSDSIVVLMNVERQAAGLHPLIVNSTLQQSSLSKGSDMMAQDYWSHNAPDRSEPWHFFDENGYTFTLAGENLAKSFVTPAGVVEGWMNSPTHRANVMKPEYKEVGISTVEGILLGEKTLLVVAHFGVRRDAPSPAVQPIVTADVPAVAVVHEVQVQSRWQRFLGDLSAHLFEPRPILAAY